MTFEQLKTIQNEAYRILQNSYYLEKISHAYIFEGDRGTGKETMAKYMAMQLLCTSESKPCLDCINCKKVIENKHLNVVIIEAENEVIKKEQIENLIHEFSMTSIEGENQIYIIKDADKMNPSASNALLKFLEEPVSNRYGFLITTDKNRLLPTIVSRTQVIHFKPISTNVLINALTNEGIEKDVAYAGSILTNNIDEIKRLISEGKIINYVKIAKNVVSAILKKEDPFLVYYANKDTFASEYEKKWHFFFLDVLALIYQELLKLNTTKNYQYFKDVIEHNKLNLVREKIDKQLELISKYQERLKYNVNYSLFYASFFCETSEGGLNE